MKHKIIFFLVLFFLILISSHAKSQMHIGIGVNYGNKVELDYWRSSDYLYLDDENPTLGFEVKGSYDINQKWSLSPSLQYYLPGLSNKSKQFKGSANFDIHRLIFNHKTIGLYALGGISYSMLYFKAKSYPKTLSESKFGTNWGIGLRTKGKVRYYSEYRFNSPFRSGILSIGAQFSL